ncbi:MAG: DUF6776 family protein [Pseudomonadales bacterium]|nr:DUF6776 family protein [Pseudomonadales bacterium]
MTAIVAVLFLLTAVGAFQLGSWKAERTHSNAVAELATLVPLHRDLTAERDRLERELSDARLGVAIGTGVDERVRSTLADQAARISDLEDEVRFYRNLMASEQEAEPMRIARLELLPHLSGGGVRFRLLLVQSADQSKEVSGLVELNVLGERDGRQETLTGDRLGAGASYPIPFRFRYFQDVAGEIELPEGFEPQSVQIVARPGGDDEFRLERTFSWQIQEV